jgi:hypothetical protein
MRIVALTISLLIFPIWTFGSEYVLGEYRRYGSDNYLELFSVSQGGPCQNAAQRGQSFELIMGLISPSANEFSIRITSPLTEEAEAEIMSFYKKNLPNELEKALRSAGNMHNPALVPLVDSFVNAFKATTLFHTFETTIREKGYKVIKVEFEKFDMPEGDLDVAEITLRCVPSSP